MKKGDWTFVTCHIGVSLKVDKYSAIYITLDKSRIQAGSVAGICGDFDDNPSSKYNQVYTTFMFCKIRHLIILF